MAIEEREENTTDLSKLIEELEKDNLPTNIFTIKDTDPMVLLGKINEVIAYLKTLKGLISSSDAKANKALESALTALESAKQALESSTSALSTANKAIASANDALTASTNAETTANNAMDRATEAKSIAEDAKAVANGADINAKEAITTATTADTNASEALSKATTADTNASEALSKATTADTNATKAVEDATNALEQANSAHDTAGDALAEAVDAMQIAKQALEQVTRGLGTKVYDTHNNLINEAKFTGHNGINVDMDETDPNEFNIRLDNTITKAIEDNHVQGQTNAQNITSLKTRVTANEEDIVELTNMLSATEELAQKATEDIANTINPRLDDMTTALDQVVEQAHNLQQTKADINNDSQTIVAKEMTATTGNFTNINDRIDSVNRSLKYIVNSHGWKLPVTNIEVSHTNAGLTTIDCTRAFGDSYTSDITRNPLFEVLIAIEAYDDGTNFVKSYSDFTGENTTVNDMRFSSNGRQGGAIRVMPLYTTLYFNKTSSMKMFKIKVMAWRKLTGSLFV